MHACMDAFRSKQWKQHGEGRRELNLKGDPERYLGGNGGVGGTTDESVMDQNDDVAMDFFGNALGAAGWYRYP